MSKCKAIVEFGDDYGDNSCTFHCELEEGHEGLHTETGSMYDKFPYTVTWESDMRLDGRPLCPKCGHHKLRYGKHTEDGTWYRCWECEHDFFVKDEDDES